MEKLQPIHGRRDSNRGNGDWPLDGMRYTFSEFAVQTVNPLQPRFALFPFPSWIADGWGYTVLPDMFATKTGTVLEATKIGDFRKTLNVDQGQKGLVLAKGVNPCGSCGKQPNHLKKAKWTPKNRETHSSMGHSRKAPGWIPMGLTHTLFSGHTSWLYVNCRWRLKFEFCCPINTFWGEESISFGGLNQKNNPQKSLAWYMEEILHHLGWLTPYH